MFHAASTADGTTRGIAGSNHGRRLAANTTTAFDGTYRGLAIRGDSGAGPGLQAVDPSTGCQPFTVPPTMTITNGLAQFQAVGAIFAGYVTPQGSLRLETGRGEW